MYTTTYYEMYKIRLLHVTHSSLARYAGTLHRLQLYCVLFLPCPSFSPIVVVVAKFGVHQKQLPEQRGARRFARVEQTETAAFAFGFFDQVSFSFEECFRSPFYIRGENVGFAFDDVCQGEFGSD